MHVERYQNPGMALVRGVPFSRLPLAARHAIHKAQLKKQATPAENCFLRHLASLGLTYRFQQGFYTPCYRIADFYLPEHKLIIEIDGQYHNFAKDRRRDDWFERARGIRTLRLTNEQVLRGEFAAIAISFEKTVDRAPHDPVRVFAR
jgi:very-short-patch-repair endonuclease